MSRSGRQATELQNITLTRHSTKKNWVDFIRSLPEGAPGQQAWEEFHRIWEGDDDQARDQAFLRLIAREYFRIIRTGEAP